MLDMCVHKAQGFPKTGMLWISVLLYELSEGGRCCVIVTSYVGGLYLRSGSGLKTWPEIVNSLKAAGMSVNYLHNSECLSIKAFEVL